MPWIGLGVGVVTGTLGFLGAQDSNRQAKDAASAQYKQAKKIYEYDWEQTVRKYDYAQVQLGIEKENDVNLRAYKEAQLTQQYNAQNERREYEYKNRVDAFNRSEDIFQQQIGVNVVSSLMAQEEATRAFNEQQISNNFQKEGLARDLFSALDTTAFAKAEVQLNKQSSIQGAANKRREAEFQYQSQRKELGFKSQQNMIEQLKAEGSARSRGTGRSAAKNIQGAMMMAGMQQAQIVENITDSKQQFKIASTSINTSMMNDINTAELQTGQLDNSIMYKQQEYNQNLRELKASMDSARANLGATKMKINLDKQVADMRANANRMLEPSIGPEIPKPPALPPSIFLEPLKPMRPPKPVKNAARTQSAMTSFANALGSLSGVNWKGLGGK
tara:strand:- start:7423 stop:8586 length:1164 start_codon:yes stop_codon:yes gene_type:complete